MATNYVKASYTEVIDLQTTNGKTSIIGIHTPVGVRPYHRLFGFFNQFRKYRYKGISSLVMVPAANLPVDPLGLTGVQGTTDLMDPRDALNPILFHGAHGENLNPILNTIYSADEYTGGNGYNTSTAGRNVSDSCSESVITNNDVTANYYKCLTDVTWKKFGIQSGVRLKGLHPLVWKMARNAPLVPSSPIQGSGTYTANAGMLVPLNDVNPGKLNMPPYTGEGDQIINNDAFSEVGSVGNVDCLTSDGGLLTPQYVQNLTYGVTRLGWIPTTKVVANNDGDLSTARFSIGMLPKLFMGVLVLPPAYNVEQFYRMVIRHEFEFSGFTSSLSLESPVVKGGLGNTPSTNNYFNWIDYGSSKKEEGVDSVGDTLDMIGGSSDIVSDGVA